MQSLVMGILFDVHVTALVEIQSCHLLCPSFKLFLGLLASFLLQN